MSPTRTINPRFTAHIAKDNPFKRDGGLAQRAYREYRDLGIAEATDGKVQAQIIRTIEPSPPEGSGLHYHDVDFQMLYVLKGWTQIWLEGEGEFRFEAGDCWIQPPCVRHHVRDFSDDYEVLEVSLPGEYETVEVT